MRHWNEKKGSRFWKMNKEELIKPNERLDELNRRGYKIIQNPECFCFGMDAVLLAAFTRIKPQDKVVDLGTGTGIIPILLEARNPEIGHITGLEIQDISVDMATRSVEYNNISDKINIMQGDIKTASQLLGASMYDVVTSNPPYMNENHGLTNPSDIKAIARHEVLCTLEDVVREAGKLLKVNGRFYMVHRPHRLVEIFGMLTKYKLEPKKVRLVHPYADKEANMVLIEAVKGGKSMIKVLEPLIIYKEQSKYTEEVYKLYDE